MSQPSRPDASAGTTDLFLVSLLVLFLELACIRWFPAHVLYLTFFTNTILLASFLGMSLGCLTAGRARNLLTLTPLVLLVSMAVGLAISAERNALEPVLRVGNPLSPQVVYFGTEFTTRDPGRVLIPIDAIEGFFFLVAALIMIGPGQELGRAFTRVPDRVRAYSANILGSLAGVLLFAAASWLELTPIWWFAVIAALVAYFLFVPSGTRPRLLPPLGLAWVAPALIVMLVVAGWTSGDIRAAGQRIGERFWSPYYRIDYHFTNGKQIRANLVGHQQMVSRTDDTNPSYTYAVPHLLRRDTGGTPFRNVLIIGAGSGNDVSRALAMGATHVDAVEIDPAIQRLGETDHPDHPYQDPRVSVHITDGRNFLRVTHGQYDLIVFALVDSLVLHSGYSNLRLESFMFTREAIADVRTHLAPDGVFAMYNYFREGWIAARIVESIKDGFGEDPIVMTLPFLDTVNPDTQQGFTILLAGNVQPIRDAFQTSGAYRLPVGKAPSFATANGFLVHPLAGEADRWIKLGPAHVVVPDNLRQATDDWPFLYIRAPMIPDLTLRGMAIMGGISALLFAWVWKTRPAGVGRRPALDGRMFFLGAGFMLIETKAVVHMALLFGSTWMVNSVVFAGVLVMILGANLFVLRARPRSLTPYYIGLFVTLALNLVVPLDSLLGFDRTWQVAASSLLAFTPILFAGVVFAVSFSLSETPDLDFGTNIAGAILGGLAENTSVLLGFQYLTVVVIVLYAASALTGRNRSRHLPAPGVFT